MTNVKQDARSHSGATKRFTSHLLSWSILATAAVGLAPAAVRAQEATAQSDEQGGLADIIVTAQRREESLQNIPVAVTALDKGRLENLHVQNFNDLAGLAPNLSAINSGSGSNPIISLRGVVGGNVEPGRDNGVAMYLDGVYVARTTGAQFDVADLERVEVLRGPQGTLYGRNSTGGAINYITAAAKGELYLRQEGSFGSLGLLRTKTRVDLPRFGAFSLSGTFLHEERDGYVDNTEAGRIWDFSGLPGNFLGGERKSVRKLGARNTEAMLLALRFQPDSMPLTVDYKFDWTNARYTNRPKQTLLDTATGLPREIPATTERLDAVPMGFTTPEHLKVFGHNLTAVLDVSDQVQLKSITGYRGFTDEYSADSGGGGFENFSPAPGRSFFAVTAIVTHERDRTFSQEVQLTYKSDLLDAIGGLYFFKQHTLTVNPIFAFQFVSPPNYPTPALVTDADNHNKSIAAFAQTTVHVTDQIDLTGGLRGTKDTRKSQTTLTVTPDFRATFKRLDWMVNATYRPTNTLMVYGKAATGYLSGGTFNQRAFDPEKMLQFEVGAKADLLDRRLRINAAAFRSSYDNLQQSSASPLPPFLFQTFNVGKARMTGAEVEITALPTDRLTLTANYGFIDFKYRSFIHPTFGDITDDASPLFWRPKHNVSLGLDYQFPEWSQGVRPSINVNARWHSNMDFYFLSSEFRSRLAGASPAAIAQSAAVDRFIHDNAVWLVNARASLANISTGDGGPVGKFSIWVRNALNKRKIESAALNTPSFIAGAFMEPRTYGLDFSVEF